MNRKRRNAMMVFGAFAILFTGYPHAVYLSAVCDESSRVEHRSGIHLLLSSHDVFCAGKYFRRRASGQKRARTGHVYRRRNPDRRGPDFKIYASSVTHMDVSDI